MKTEAYPCNVSKGDRKLLAPRSKASHQFTSSPPSDCSPHHQIIVGFASDLSNSIEIPAMVSIVTDMPFAGSAIAQGVKLKDLVRGLESTKWFLLAGSSDPPCKTSERRARAGDREGSFLRGVSNDLAVMERSPIVRNCLHNTVRNGS